MKPALQRTTFETPRASEYFSSQELQAQTGQPPYRFASVVLKEIVDNALDAAESAGVFLALKRSKE
jgi:DNA topoisomerase VI subunit B